MNAAAYQLSKVARFFGFRFERNRLAALTRESQFLQEAIDLLGRAAWQDTSEIDDVAVEFWQIRDTEQKQVALKEQMETIKAESQTLEEERARIEHQFSTEINELKEQKIEIMGQAIGLMRDNDASKANLERVKRRYAGMKLRLKAIEEGNHPGGDDPAQLQQMMDDLKATYSQMQGGLESGSSEVKTFETQIAEVDSNLETRKSALRAASAEIVGQIGKAAKQLADLSAQIGSLQNSKNALANRIGHFLSQHVESPPPEVKSVLRKHGALTSKIKYFRRSIHYNQRLSRGM